MSKILIAALAVCFAVPVSAQDNCATRERVTGNLESKYGETRQSIGVAPQNQVVEVWANEETGTWTITVTLPNGTTCLVASGQGYERIGEPQGVAL